MEVFLFSLHDIGGILAGAYGETSEQLALRHAMLYGFPASLLTTIRDEGRVLKFGETQHVPWETAQIWDRELNRPGS
jgi:hypothetical protein